LGTSPSRRGAGRHEAQEILTAISERLVDEFDIEHATIQVEFRDIVASGPEL
jgi:Co/Zn/Cd efflux system component